MPQLNLLLCATTCLAIVVGTSAQNDRILVITSHESLSAVFVDNVEAPIPNANERNVTDSVLVPREARLIAVQAVSTTESCAGFIGSVTNNYLVTDASWKCSQFGDERWFLLGFDDSSWPHAEEVGRNGDVPACPNLDEQVPDISVTAHWIWTEQQDPDPVTTPVPIVIADPVPAAVFCRGYLPFCEVYQPCVNGGTCLENGEELCACPPEWAGRYCEKVWTPCANDPCLNNGTCIITSDMAYHCQCAIGFTGANCETNYQYRNLTITVKSTLYDLYVDGVRQNNLTHANNWTFPDVVPITPTNRLIGVMAIDSTETCAGILGSVTDDFLVTDGINWRCGVIPDVHWFELGWDDTAWPLAYPLKYNETHNLSAQCNVLTDVPPISENAYWIWTDNILEAPYYYQTIYCRGYLPVCDRESPCYNGGTCNRNNETLCSCLVGFIGEYCQDVDYKRVSVTAKEHLYAAYVDGEPITLKNGTNWRIPDSFPVKSISRLIALMAIQLDGPCPGILASVTDNRGDYVLSDALWKCSPSAEVGWSELGYDDSTWAAARLIRINDNTNDTQCQDYFDEIASISSDAYWIWTNNPNGQDVVAFCRGYLPICDVSPCKNGGVCNKNAALMCTCDSSHYGDYCQNEVIEYTTYFSENAQVMDSGQKSNDTANAEKSDKRIQPPHVGAADAPRQL